VLADVFIVVDLTFDVIIRGLVIIPPPEKGFIV
jgi:hypothetical protein